MTPHTDESDMALLDDLRRVVAAIDEIPPESVELARAALGWRSLDNELAELIHDSAVDEHQLVVRGAHDGLRVLSFANDQIRIDVEFSNGQLVGQVSPPEQAVIELHRDGSEPIASASTDEFGAFTLSDVTPGPLALVCRAEDGRWSVRTSWTAL